MDLFVYVYLFFLLLLKMMREKEAKYGIRIFVKHA